MPDTSQESHSLFCFSSLELKQTTTSKYINYHTTGKPQMEAQACYNQWGRWALEYIPLWWKYFKKKYCWHNCKEYQKWATTVRTLLSFCKWRKKTVIVSMFSFCSRQRHSFMRFTLRMDSIYGLSHTEIWVFIYWDGEDYERSKLGEVVQELVLKHVRLGMLLDLCQVLCCMEFNMFV